jgi:hypothetical protein
MLDRMSRFISNVESSYLQAAQSFSSTLLVSARHKYAYCNEGIPSILRRSSVTLQVVIIIIIIVIIS